MSASRPQKSARRKMRRRNHKHTVDLFAKHDDDVFHNLYRISKEAVLRIRDHLNLKPLIKRNKSIDGLTQLLIALRFFATGSYQQVMDDLRPNMQISTISHIIQHVSQKLAQLGDFYIEMPTKGEIMTVASEFHDKTGLLNVIGAMGCTNVKIKGSRSLYAEYRCEIGEFAINVQIICDPNYTIRDIIARWPNSIDKNIIFTNSHLFEEFEKGKFMNHSLISGTGYVTKNYLITTESQTETASDEVLNETFKIAETCFQIWKQRFPCLNHGINLMKTEISLQIIVATAVLHNMCIEIGEKDPPNDNIKSSHDNPSSSIVPNKNANPEMQEQMKPLKNPYDSASTHFKETDLKTKIKWELERKKLPLLVSLHEEDEEGFENIDEEGMPDSPVSINEHIVENQGSQGMSNGSQSCLDLIEELVTDIASESYNGMSTTSEEREKIRRRVQSGMLRYRSQEQWKNKIKCANGKMSKKLQIQMHIYEKERYLLKCKLKHLWAARTNFLRMRTLDNHFGMLEDDTRISRAMAEL